MLDQGQCREHSTDFSHQIELNLPRQQDRIDQTADGIGACRKHEGEVPQAAQTHLCKQAVA